jgi:hypothetical protein
VVPKCRRLPDRGRAMGRVRVGPGPALMRTSGARSCYTAGGIVRPGEGGAPASRSSSIPRSATR